MKEKLQEYALLAEIISALCIVLSLVFVGLQVQQGAEATDSNTEAARAQVRESIMNAEVDVLSMAADHPYLLRFDFDPNDYTQQEVGRASAYFIIMTRTREDFWVQHTSGYLDESTYKSYRRVLLLMLEGSSFFRAAWQGGKANGLNPGFVAEIEAALLERGIDINNIDPQ